MTILSKLFIKNKDELPASKLRDAYGTLCCVLGIVLNVILFGIKYLAGVISKSIAITADAFNNRLIGHCACRHKACRHEAR